ncbi:MAG TPA: cytochrome c [Candidatus Baltobacteraceae bacterium]|nr:cytochrome c [Candidatus Baltobacteraceae bacterium]
MKARVAGFVILALTVLFALAPAYRGEIEIPVRVHHLLHAVILVGAAVSGLLIARRGSAPFSARALWLFASIIAPMLAMLLMWPSEYSPLERLPAAHVFEHLGLLLLGFVTAYAGQQYASGVGVAMSLSLWTMAFLSAWGFGVSPPLQVAAVNAAAAPAAQTASNPAGSPAGKAIFAQNCSSCHGAKGQGGMGPSLVNESSRKNFHQAAAWIENPSPPMPKLYPSTLTARDVRDVAAYVESLK